MVAANKNLLLQGEQELDKMCSSLAMCEPNYDSLFDAYLRYEFKLTNVGSGTSGRKGNKAVQQ